jgi:hypothetical protein
MVCPPVTSEAGARRPRSISNFGGLCQTRKTPTVTGPGRSKRHPALAVPNVTLAVFLMIWFQNCLGINVNA